MDAVMLAAGNSRRFGANKLLYEIGGRPMYRHALDLLCGLQREGALDRIILVTQYERIREEARKCGGRIRTVINDRPDLGISRSIRLGLQELARGGYESEACLFTVSDQPYLKPDSVRGLIRAYREGTHGIAVCVHGDRPGNPVIFGKMYYEELSGLTGDTGGKRLVRKYPEDVLRYPVEERELEDIDVPGVLAGK